MDWGEGRRRTWDHKERLRHKRQIFQACVKECGYYV